MVNGDDNEDDCGCSCDDSNDDPIECSCTCIRLVRLFLLLVLLQSKVLTRLINFVSSDRDGIIDGAYLNFLNIFVLFYLFYPPFSYNTCVPRYTVHTLYVICDQGSANSNNKKSFRFLI